MSHKITTLDSFKKNSPQLEKQKILIVDDDDGFLDFLSQALEPDYQVITAYNGETALKAFHRDLPDLVITDLVMPRLDGFVLVNELRRVTEAPIVVVSGGDVECSREYLRTLGIRNYLSKPFKPDDLLQLVDDLLVPVEALKKSS